MLQWIESLLQYGLQTGLIDGGETVYTRNLLLDVMREDAWQPTPTVKGAPLHEILAALTDAEARLTAAAGDLDGRLVPEVLLNGDHAKIRAWRRRESLRATMRYRPDLLKTADLSPDDLKVLKELENECSSES